MQRNESAALDLYKRCIEILEEKFGSGYPGTVSAHVNIGLILCNQKKYDQALLVFLKAQKLAESNDELFLIDLHFRCIGK